MTPPTPRVFFVNVDSKTLAREDGVNADSKEVKVACFVGVAVDAVGAAGKRLSRKSDGLNAAAKDYIGRGAKC